MDDQQQVKTFFQREDQAINCMIWILWRLPPPDYFSEIFSVHTRTQSLGSLSDFVTGYRVEVVVKMQSWYFIHTNPLWSPAYVYYIFYQVDTSEIVPTVKLDI